MDRIHSSQKRMESGLVTFLVLTELEISISKDEVDRLDDVLQKKENSWISQQSSKNRINRSAELILSKVYLFFKEKYSIQLDKNNFENSTKQKNRTKNTSEIIQSLSDLELIKLNKIIKVLRDQKYLELRNLIAEFKETSTTEKTRSSALLNLLGICRASQKGKTDRERTKILKDAKK